MRWPKRRPRFRDDPERGLAHRIARDLGMTVAELGRRMSAREFYEWAAFYKWEAAEQAKAQREAR